MDPNVKILRAVRVSGATILAMGIMVFLTGLYVNDFNVMVPIGIGTVIGSIFIFLMGVFFVASEEMLEKREKGIITAPMHTKKGASTPTLQLVYSADRKRKR